MNKCIDCNNIAFCKHYDSMKNMVGVIVDVCSCIHYTSSATTIEKAIETQTQIPIAPDKPREYIDYSSIPEITKEELELLKHQSVTEKLSDLTETGICDECEKEYKKSELTETFDLNNKEKLIYICDHCFGYGVNNKGKWDITNYIKKDKEE